MPPGNLAMKMPPGFRPTGGTLLFAQVAGKDGQGYLMKMGPHLVRAQSGTPLQVGQSVQLRVQSEKGGNFQMQMMPGTPSARHSLSDLTTSLSNLKIAVSEGNLETAKAMVENKLPLTKDNLETMQRLTRMPEGSKTAPPLATRVSAVVFLQQNQLPVTPQNMSSLSNFLAQNPQIGQQMAAMSDELRRQINRGSDSRGFEQVREMVLEAIEGGGGGIATGKKSPPKAPPKKFFSSARQAGIEFGTSPFPGSDEDGWEMLTRFRELKRKGGQALGEDFAALMHSAEENLQAQQLLNKARLGEIGCLYFQVPLRLELGEQAEIWLYYRRKENGEDTLGEEFRAEFLVTTEHLGGLFFIVEVDGFEVSTTIEVEEPAALECLERYAPVLHERIQGAGWRSLGVEVCERKTVPGNPWVQPPEPMQEMAAYDVQA